MAGIMDEYDPPTPLQKVYCARLNNEEYENQASQCTEEALLHLLQHLENTPDSYRRVLRKRKQQEKENEGLLSFIKVRLSSLFYDQPDVSDAECNAELTKVKEDMMKAFHYSQEAKGRRYSKRLAERRKRELSEHSLSSNSSRRSLGPSEVPMPVTTPAAPPPPPPLPPTKAQALSCATPKAGAALTRRPLSTCGKKHPEIKKKRQSSFQPSNFSLQDVMQELKCPGKALRNTVERSPGGTPINGWSRPTCDSNAGYFNTKLVEKFKSIRSPANTPSPLAYSAAPPGSFDSPVLADSPSSSQSQRTT